MEIDFDQMDNVSDYVSVPAGTYLCRTAEVIPGTTRNGHERWGIRLIVAEGEFVGRQAAWDGLVFSERGTMRARRVLAALGLPTQGKVKVEPQDLVGRQAFVTVKPQDFRDPTSGRVVRRNQVPYEGWMPCTSPIAAPRLAPDEGGTTSNEDDDEPDFQKLPF